MRFEESFECSQRRHGIEFFNSIVNFFTNELTMVDRKKLQQIFFNKRSGVLVWILSWPLVSLLFESNPHYFNFFKPIGVFMRSVSAPEGYYWSSTYIETFVFPAAVFWFVLISVIVLLPSKQG